MILQLLILFIKIMDCSSFDKFVIKGIFIDTKTMDSLRIRNGYLLIENGLIQQFSNENPDINLKLYDYSDKLIIPGLSDLHLHALNILIIA